MLTRVPLGTFRGLTLETTGLQDHIGLSEHELTGVVRRLSRGIATAIDVGAAQGWYAAYFLARTNAKRVIAIEPHPPHVEALRANATRNADAKRLEVIPACVGAARSGTADQILTLDDLLPLPTPVLVKIDIEGAELEALRGATELLWLGDVRWIIETHSADLERDCEQLLRRAGYSTKIIHPAWWRRVLPEARQLAHNQWLIASKYV